jgi:predicted DCC family thiol-disulfide oxidoreductase YuxK
MKHYRLFVFTQDNCNPCYRLKEYISRLPHEQQKEVTFYPFKTGNGERTVMAKELGVEVTPTLVVLHEDTICENDDAVIDQCIVETIVGAQNIITALPATISDYTYTKTEIDDIHPDQSNGKGISD